MPPVFQLTDTEIQRLGETGWFFRDDWLGKDTASAAASAAKDARSSGRLKAAGVGRGGDHRLDGGIRGDLISWVTQEDLVPAFKAVHDAFDSLRTELNEKAYVGLRKFELQLAVYPGHGERYQRHKDAFVGDDNRRMTAIVYLNQAWRPEHGGQLRIHGHGQVDLWPLLDRLVVFTSARVEHEVLPAHAERWAMTAWYSAR
jgi:SM-20-related protein